jgi:hypothetical protein
MGLLISLLVVVAILAIIFWAFNQMPLPQPIRIVVVVAVAIIAIFVLLHFFPIEGYRPLRW